MNSFTMKMSVAQALAVHGLPHPPNPPWPLALLVQYWGLPHVPWYQCREHVRGFHCPLCQMYVGSNLVLQKKFSIRQIAFFDTPAYTPCSQKPWRTIQIAFGIMSVSIVNIITHHDASPF